MPPRAKKVSQKQTRNRKRYLVSLRLGPENRQNLERASAESGRSLGAEAEARLEWSFHSDRSLLEALHLKFGEFMGVMLLAAEAAELMGQLQNLEGPFHAIGPRIYPDSPRDWLDNPVAYRKAVEAAIRVLNAFKPTGDDQDDPKPGLNAQEVVGSVLLSKITNDPPQPVRPVQADLIKRRLNRATLDLPLSFFRPLEPSKKGTDI